MLSSSRSILNRIGCIPERRLIGSYSFSRLPRACKRRLTASAALPLSGAAERQRWTPKLLC